ncbi:hypothetical protein TraAM80_06288 [Trypanosoma rangeli]|uniref:Uncharacterized protein n=1 Tax=Trypanosoma rangeli TaxID=5698 RepID=A0A422NAT6_TRYRA|nr:uncharacterized protein TraAM80_06288 [Trypanosoma rangeli]RNF02588.1 hypothetical protein TraAM80_06288 [Trypanosoma rangeli]|eukprot:RNF02588.1 hypothetical protein TraAM80_06288 [Trypanosoma rangeli]
MSLHEIKDVLLSESVVRLPPQYDATDFLQLCSLNEQYRILASICRSESQRLLRRLDNDCSARHSDGSVNATEKAEQQHDGIPDVYYSARLLAFMSGCGQETGALNILKKEGLRQQQQREKEEEEQGELSRRCKDHEVEEAEAAERAQHAQEEGEKRDGYETANQELWYNEEGGYYYDSYGYYDAEGNYYNFEGEEAGEAGQEAEETIEELSAQVQEAVIEGMPRESQHSNELDGDSDVKQLAYRGDAFVAELSRPVSDVVVEKLTTSLRVVPDESQLALSPFFRGVCALERVFQVLEQSLTPVDVFLRDNDLFPSIPVCTVANSNTAWEGTIEKICPECIHVLATKQHLHIVYVPTPFSKGREQHVVDEQGENLGIVAPFLDFTMQSGVLVSIPLHSWYGSCTTFYGALGDGRVLFEMHVAPSEHAATTYQGNGMTLSMIFGISPDASFRAAPLASRLIECYQQRVLHHLAKSGGNLEELIPLQLINANSGSLYASDILQPLFGYSALLLCKDAGNTYNINTMGELVYDAASNSVFFSKEYGVTEREELRLEETLYLARNMEPPQWCFLREALDRVQQQESEEREKLNADAWAFYRRDHQPSFHYVALFILPFLRMQEASMAELKKTEQRQRERLFQQFLDRRRQVYAEETRRRLNEQFAFERRLQLLQCSIDFDVLVEREKAMRAMTERDEVLERHSGELQECLLTLLTCQRMGTTRQTTPVREEDVIFVAGRGEKRALRHMEKRFGRELSHSQDPQQKRRVLGHSAQSLAVDDFVQMVADGHRGPPLPCASRICHGNFIFPRCGDEVSVRGSPCNVRGGSGEREKKRGRYVGIVEKMGEEEQVGREGERGLEGSVVDRAHDPQRTYRSSV